LVDTYLALPPPEKTSPGGRKEASPLIEKVCLGVFHDNLPAIGLYRKFGFKEEGRQPRGIKLGPGDYQDVILMYPFVGGMT
jgi:ribosomal protein S18 acetylase RimI-like enzyme